MYKRQEIYRVLKPDGLFLCSIFGSETLNELKYSLCEAEEKISKLVISSNQALIWDTIRSVKIRSNIGGYGQLLLN